MEIFVFYFLFAWAVVYKVFDNDNDTDAIGENLANIFMSFVFGWFVLPMIIGTHLRGKEPLN